MKKGNYFETNSIISNMIKGKYPTKTINTDIGEFEIKYPTGKDFREIALRKSSILGGNPISSFDMNFVMVANRDATLSVIISKYPEEYPEDWKGTRVDECPLEEVKNSILKEFNTFFSDTQKSISGKPTE